MVCPILPPLLGRNLSYELLFETVCLPRYRYVNRVSFSNEDGLADRCVFGTSGFQISSITEQILSLAMTTVAIIYTGVCAINWAESLDASFELNMFLSFYLIIITISTVGYGDVVPETDLGRVVIIIIVIVAVLVIPWKVSSLLQAIQQSKAGGGRFRAGGDRHVVLIGSFPYESSIMDSLGEFLAVDSFKKRTSIVILSPDPLDSRVLEQLRLPYYKSRVTILRGSVLVSAFFDDLCPLVLAFIQRISATC